MADEPKPTPDRNAIREFLALAQPGGPWVLTAIPVGGGRTATQTAFDIDAAAGWAAAQNELPRNVYWTVNRAHGAPDSKPTKAGMEAALFLHIDVDPAKGSEPGAERERILDALRTFVPEPSIVIDSGGGGQAFWRLDAPLPLEGTILADVEARNRRLAELLGGDNCHNIHRILREAGTVNWPDENKLAKGRRARLARLVARGPATYSLDAFEPSVATAKVGPSHDGATVQLPADLPCVELDDLPAAVDTETRALIANGSNRHNSRSEAVWRVAHELIRAGCDDATIAAVLLDPRHAPYAHVREQKGGERDYVIRQIERARADAPAGGRRVLDPDNPYASALRLRDELYPHMLHTNGDFFTWRGGAYRKVEDATMERDAWRELSDAVVRRKQDDAFVYLPFKPKPGNVDAYLRALRGIVHVPAEEITPPAWLEGDGPPPLEIVALRNGLLHVPSGELLPPTPRFFTRNALCIDFDAEAPVPADWLRFVEQVFPDPVAAALLQEWFGYLLLPDTSQEKMLLLVGPPRSGKGTIQKVLTELIGPANVCAPSIKSLGGGFGLQPMIGKQVAFLSDIRIGRGSDREAITETLLRITGQDDVTADRKNKEAWTGRLAVRFVISTNELPSLRDNSPALAYRFTPLMMEQSFLGREDHSLPNRIIANELPGVLLWALEGWRRLHERGRFALPAASEEVIAEILDLGSPVAAFVNARCELDDAKSVEKEALYRAYCRWCEGTKQYAVAANVFGRDLRAATGGRVKPGKKRTGRSDDDRVPVYRGVGLRDELGSEGWQPGPEHGPAGLPFSGEAQWGREPY